MSTEQEHLESIREMRNLMERSSRYLSLSGLAGVLVGMIALGGLASLSIALDIPLGRSYSLNERMQVGGAEAARVRDGVLVTAAIVLLLSVVVEYLLAAHKARTLGLPLWDSAARRMLTALVIPVMGGGIYCIRLVDVGDIDGLLPVTLIFYGLGLVHAGRYAVPDVSRLGLAVFVTGLVATFYPPMGLFFWGIGFGVLHIIYGITIHFKHER